jgi:uncharacterized surface protein with fasciclin (FAS1) repeats
MNTKSGLAIVLCGLLVFSACGDDDSSSDAPATNNAVNNDSGNNDPGNNDPGNNDPGNNDPGNNDPGNNDPAPLTIAEIASADENFSTLVAAADAAGLVPTLSDANAELTVFAPTNDAFEALFEATGLTAEELLADTDLLTAVLTYHAVPGTVNAATVVGLDRATTVNGADVFIKVVGESVFINNSLVTTADIEASNGMIHVIDAVILPPVGETVVDIAVGDEDFSTLVGAVTDGGLVETLSSAGPFTVFAPINAAFDALDEVPTGDALVDVLTYHVLPEARYSRTLTNGEELVTVNGESATITLDGGAFIDGIEIIATDIPAGNGVIHVIDGILLP